MLPGRILAFAAFVIGTLAAPLNSSLSESHFLDKRAQPVIPPGLYTKQQEEQLIRAHQEAIKLASRVLSGSRQKPFDRVSNKYFDINDKQTVLDVFKEIVDKDDGKGIGILGDIKFVADSIITETERAGGEKRSDEDYLTPDGVDPDTASSGDVSSEDEGGLSCVHNTQSELRKYKTAAPELIICPKAFDKGTLGDNPWANVPKVKCDSCYPRISYKMETLGHSLLHEYTHWQTLMAPVVWPFHIRAAVDMDNSGNREKGYGPWETTELRKEDKDSARKNADNYAWLATEVYWAQECIPKHGPFREATKRDN